MWLDESQVLYTVNKKLNNKTDDFIEKTKYKTLRFEVKFDDMRLFVVDSIWMQ